MVLAAVGRELPNTNFSLTGESEKYFVADLPNCGTTLFIYRDQAEVSGGPSPLIGEHHDYATPEELVLVFLSAARAAGAT